MKKDSLLSCIVCGMFWLLCVSSPVLAQSLVAFDHFDESAGLLDSKIKTDIGTQDGLLDPFADRNDHFGLTDGKITSSAFLQRPPNALINSNNSACLDYFPTDNIGAVPCDYANTYFGIVDTDNPANSGLAEVHWVFDISQALRIDQICLDVAAMGDFENDDVWEIMASTERDPIPIVLASLLADESGVHTYTMGDRVVVLDDPMTISGRIVSNQFETFCFDVPALTGRELTITITGRINGNEEAIALDNLEIFGTEIDGTRGPAPNCIEQIIVSAVDPSLVVIPTDNVVTNIGENKEMVVEAVLLDKQGMQLNRQFVTANKDLVYRDLCKLHNQELILQINTPGGSCQTALIFEAKTPEHLNCAYGIQNYWCFDAAVNLDVQDMDNLGWYRTTAPFTTKPLLTRYCGDTSYALRELGNIGDYDVDGEITTSDTLAYVRDYYRPLEQSIRLEIQSQLVNHPCGGDTSAILYRRWYAQTQKSNLLTCTDTIVVFSLPKLMRSNFVPQDDTLRPIDKEITYDSLAYPAICWKDFPFLHTDDLFLLKYPRDLVDSACQILQNTINPAVIEFYDTTPIVALLSGEELTICEISSRATISGDYYSFPLSEVRRFLSGAEHTYADTPSDFLPGDTTPIDLCIPFVEEYLVRTDTTVWSTALCPDGLILRLPRRPGDTECTLHCLSQEQLEACGVRVSFVDKDLHTSCPIRSETLIQLKPTCLSEDSLGCSGTNVVSGVDSTKDGWSITNYITRIEDRPPELKLLSPLIAEMNHSSCQAMITNFPIKVYDEHSGVKAVSVSHADFGIKNLVKDSLGESWRFGNNRTHTVKYQKNSTVSITVIDSCENQSSVEVPITFSDPYGPVCSLDDSIQYAMTTSSREFVPIEALLLGATDNCQLTLVAARRKDWYEHDVEICSQRLLDLPTKEDIVRFLNGDDVFSVLEDNIGQPEVEFHYRQYIQRLRTSSMACADDVYQGWKRGLAEAILRQCDFGRAIHDLPDPTEYNDPIGAGWTDQIPVSCEDYCQTIPVEVLIMDDFCNYCMSTIFIQVQHQQDTRFLQNLDDLKLHCATLTETNLGILLDAAIAFGSSDQGPFARLVYQALDGLVGGYSSAELHDESGLVGSDSREPVPREDLILNYLCPEVASKNNPQWIVDSLPFRLGYYERRCRMEVIQSIEDKRDECGLGEVIRTWHFNPSCGANAARERKIQKLSFENNCASNRQYFCFAQDVDTCVIDIEQDVSVIAPYVRPTHLFPEAGCMDLAFSYMDETFRSPGVVKIHRTHQVGDWCSGETASHIQKIVLRQCMDTEDPDAAKNMLPSSKSKIIRCEAAPTAFLDKTTLYISSQKTLGPIHLRIFDAMQNCVYQMSYPALTSYAEIPVYASSLTGLGMFYYEVHVSGELFYGSILCTR